MTTRKTHSKGDIMLTKILANAGNAAFQASASLEARSAVRAAMKTQKEQAKTAAKAERERQIQEIIAQQKTPQV